MNEEKKITNELDMMMEERKLIDRVGGIGGKKNSEVMGEDIGGSTVGFTTSAARSFKFSKIELMAVFIVPVSTLVGHVAMSDGMYWMRFLLVLMSAMTMTMMSFVFSKENTTSSSGRGLTFMVACFQWSCVVVEMIRMMT